jgi:hypothetical protein
VYVFEGERICMCVMERDIVCMCVRERERERAKVIERVTTAKQNR